MTLLVETCPSFRSRWREVCGKPDFDEELLYVHLGDFADHLVGLLKAGRTGEFPGVFTAIERLHVEGDAYVREAATISACLRPASSWSGRMITLCPWSGVSSSTHVPAPIGFVVEIMPQAWSRSASFSPSTM